MPYQENQSKYRVLALRAALASKLELQEQMERFFADSGNIASARYDALLKGHTRTSKEINELEYKLKEIHEPQKQPADILKQQSQRPHIAHDHDGQPTHVKRNQFTYPTHSHKRKCLENINKTHAGEEASEQKRAGHGHGHRKDLHSFIRTQIRRGYEEEKAAAL